MRLSTLPARLPRAQRTFPIPSSTGMQLARTPSMRYLALCCDYDGTLATEGEVFPETAAALERLIASKRRPVLVTGRELDQLQTVCPYLDLFE